jgi:hypothetical protein
MVWGAIGWD